MTSLKIHPQGRLPQDCSHCVYSDGFEEVNRICEQVNSESIMCRLSCERNENNKAVVLPPNLISNIADIYLVPDSALHCFNPLEVGVKPFEMTPDDIILWNEGNNAEIMDIEEENTFCIKCSSGIHVKDKQAILLSEFEKQMILQADANSRNTPDTQKDSNKKPSPEQLDKVYNVLRVTVSIRIHKMLHFCFELFTVACFSATI
jgi:hypothetical protein